MKRLLLTAAFSCLATILPPALAEQGKPSLVPTAPPPRFLEAKDGDTIVFLGDSITHQCLYSQYIETFFYTRYPDRKIRFHNAGVSGDRAADALARFDDDVAAIEPDFVTVLLGMNDGAYEPFHAETFATYREGMEEIVKRIEAIGAKPVLLSPTMFDHHQLALRKEDENFRFRDRSFDDGYNALMAYYGAWLRETAGARGLPFVNLWGPLNDLTFAARRAEPDFSLVEDAIHPGAAGQFIMAWSLVHASRPERHRVSDITVMRRNGEWIPNRNEEITDLVVSPGNDEASFTHRAKALPWIVPEESSAYELKWGPSAPARLGYRMTNAGHRNGLELLRIGGLAPGNYELRIDDTVIGTFSHANLASKIELQQYPETPQSRQALRVAELNRERNDEAIRPLRDLWARVKGVRRKGGETFAKEYPALRERIEELRKKGEDYEQRIREAAVPEPRNYRLRRVEAGPGA